MKSRLSIISFLLFFISHSVDCQTHIVKIDQDEASVWTFEGKGKWEIRKNTLEITENSINRDPYSAPSALAIYQVHDYASFELNVEIKSNAPQSETRGDMLIIFGYQSPTQYYYAHLTGTVDSIHNGVFIVDNADRRKVDFTEFKPVLADRKWHKIRLTRNVETGSVKIYKDGDRNPIIAVHDKTFSQGKIGFGSFNDTGEIKNIVITTNN